MKIRKTHGPKSLHFIRGLCDVVDGIVRAVTLGFYWSDLGYRFTKNNMMP